MTAVSNNSVPQDVAVTLTTNWRQYYADACGITDPNSDQVFRGFTVPMDDLLSLVDLYKNAGLGIDGVRIYIAKGEILDTDPPVVGGDPNLIHVLLVPVSGAINIDNPTAATAPITHDILHDKTGKSTIYDFTAPCPSICDNLSVLFSSKNTTP